MSYKGRRVRITQGRNSGREGRIESEPVSGTAKGELVVQVKLDGPEASIIFPLSALEILADSFDTQEHN
jgi:hypothetical protein